MWWARSAAKSRCRLGAEATLRPLWQSDSGPKPLNEALKSKREELLEQCREALGKPGNREAFNAQRWNLTTTTATARGLLSARDLPRWARPLFACRGPLWCGFSRAISIQRACQSFFQRQHLAEFLP